MIHVLKYLLALSISASSFSSFAQVIQFSEQEQKWIDSHPKIEFGYDPNWAPYEIFEEGEYTGVVGEYIKRIELATGIDLIPIPNISWQESLNRLKKGTLNMVPSCAQTEERSEFLLFTKPYVVDPVIIATRRDYQFVGSIEELHGTKVAVPYNYWTNDFLKRDHPEINVIEKSSIQACMDALSYEEVDAIIGTLGVISFYINNKGYTNLKVAAPSNYEAVKISMAFTKDWHIFRDICEKVISTVSIQERNRIRKDWISIRYEYAFNWSKAFTWLLIITAVLLSGFILFYLWNRSLQKEINAKIIAEDNLKISLEKIKKSKEEKEVLLQEVHHRVKNNLQIVTSLIRLQARSSENEIVKNSLFDATERIKAISLIHEKIYNTKDLSHISTEDYIKTLVEDITESISMDNQVDVKINAKTKTLDLQASLPIALILNELITNSLKYAFKNNSEGKINIDIEEKNNEFHLKYADNGKWLENIDSKKFGTSLVDIFTEQLNGTYEVIKQDDGTFYAFKFNLSNRS